MRLVDLWDLLACLGRSRSERRPREREVPPKDDTKKGIRGVAALSISLITRPRDV
jgi:hypothetical protein